MAARADTLDIALSIKRAHLKVLEALNSTDKPLPQRLLPNTHGLARVGQSGGASDRTLTELLKWEWIDDAERGAYVITDKGRAALEDLTASPSPRP